MDFLYRLSAVLLSMCFMLLPAVSFGYDDKKTHRKINGYAVDGSGMDHILRGLLGFKKGRDEILLGNKAQRWIEEGGEREDDFPLPRNHFHDPLVGDWENASLDWGPSIFEGVSSLVWAQERFSNIYSWSKARNAYYHVFTCPSNDIPQALNPEYYMCRTLRSLGHKLESENQHGQ